MPVAKPPLILPSDQTFYDLPPPPGSDAARSFESMLADVGASEDEDRRQRDEE